MFSSSFQWCMDTGLGPASGRNLSLCSLYNLRHKHSILFLKNQKKIPHKNSSKNLRKFRQASDEYLEGLSGLSFLWARVLFVMFVLLDNCARRSYHAEKEARPSPVSSQGWHNSHLAARARSPCPAGSFLRTLFYFTFIEHLKISV